MHCTFRVWEDKCKVFSPYVINCMTMVKQKACSLKTDDILEKRVLVVTFFFSFPKTFFPVSEAKATLINSQVSAATEDSHVYLQPLTPLHHEDLSTTPAPHWPDTHWLGSQGCLHLGFCTSLLTALGRGAGRGLRITWEQGCGADTTVCRYSSATGLCTKTGSRNRSILFTK